MKPKTKVGRLKSKILSHVSLLFKLNHTAERIRYPQLWYCLPSDGLILKIIQCICGFTEHEQSKTEWGYSGGEYADSWCRWCNKLLRVPKTSICFRPNGSKNFISQIGKEIKGD